MSRWNRNSDPLPDLTGRRVVVTGATQGIGLEAALALAGAGADVAIVGRDPARTAAALERVKAAAKHPEGAQSFLGDFASLSSVRALAADLLARLPRLHVLLNNAGAVFDKRTLTADGIEATFAVNHLAPFLLTELVLERVIASGDEVAPARIVNVSSVQHLRGDLDLDDVGYERGGYWIMGAYQRSKLCNVLYTRELARRLGASQRPVTVNALHPGGVATNIYSGAPWWSKPVLAVAKLFMDSPREGGRRLTFLASHPSVARKSGRYFQDDVDTEASALARDDALADRLVATSRRLCGLYSADHLR